MIDRVNAKEHARSILRGDLSACVGAYMFSILMAFAPFAAAAGSVGLWRYNLDVVRGGRPRASKTLRGFDSFSRALALQMWNLLFILLWQLPALGLFIIGLIIVIPSSIYSAMNMFATIVYSGAIPGLGVLIVLSIVAVLWLIFINIYKGSQYMFSYAILADHPELTAKQCLDASVKLTTPFIGSIVIARLSFIGWVILSAWTSGIAGMLYIFPYMNLTWADVFCQMVPRDQWGSAGGGDSAAPPHTPQSHTNGSSVSLSAAAGSVVGVAGYYMGFRFPIGDGEILGIGRDSKQAQIVFADSEDSKKISRLHCTVNFSAARNVYTVTDRSSNGTFRADGSALPPNTPVELSRGTTIYLGSPNNSFRLE